MANSVVYMHHWFWKHGVMVKVPVRKRGIKPQRKDPTPSIKSMPATPGVFDPLRVVIDLKMVKADPPNAVVTSFTPHIIIRVRYDQKDLDDAKKRGRKLALGYWDGTKWVCFTETDHSFAPLWDEKKNKGWAEVRLTNLIDPPLALGT